MPRPRKGRMVCCLPTVNRFGPTEGITHDSDVIMTVEEYETIRLLDLEGLTQEEAAEQMSVARTTVQRMYASARKKIAEILFNGLGLRIEGGDYEIGRLDGRGYRCSRCAGPDERRVRRQGRGMGRGHGQDRRFR